jgi:hypothetical protein
MVRQHVDEENLTVHELPEQRDSLLPVAGGVTVVVTQAFGPTGASLVGVSDVVFDGYPAVTLKITTPDGREGMVHVSPIHGDRRKAGFTDIANGTRVKLMCPVTGKPLDKLGAVDDGSGADYYAIYLTQRLSKGACVMVTDIWGHYHSRIVDDNAVISHWARTHPDQ